MSQPRFSRRLLRWYDRHGRPDLPWRLAGNPYHTWVSEIMLQQTQVDTVIPYFHRFVERFPNVASLAHADLDSVLHLWTGLGYYARARNLHRAAKIMVEKHDGQLPRDFAALQALPGIGRSTAAAIAALAFGQRQVILDGNVKRVLTRYHAIDGWPGKREVENQLWALADLHTPDNRLADYTQAIMDLGATVCRRARPYCEGCPVRISCKAFAQGNPQDYPSPAPRRSLPVQAVTMVMIRDQRGRVLLQQRPPAGVWGGLWTFPECNDDDVPAWCRDTLGLSVRLDNHWQSLRHSFTHFHLDITPVDARVLGAGGQAMENPDVVWYNPDKPDERGLPVPVKRLLGQLRETS
jgi:A/G-specific adenine glycosylase